VTLTKAELADALFEELGLNKREAKEFVDLFFEEMRTKRSNFRALAILNCAPRTSAQGATPKPAKKSRSSPGASSPSGRARNCA
jgi:nucleoid DNA-binding protein